MRALFGWAPGGTAVAAATLCAFFTLFTGGSGVTILALGGLLLPALLKEGYRERFAIGLLTASGSLGLLFPLSVPLILYGIVAQNVAIEDLFIGGLLPGLLMLALLAALGVREGRQAAAPRGRRSGSARCRAALWDAKWEMLLPVVVLWALLGGYATTSESAAIAALYALIVQRFVHRDLPSFEDVRARRRRLRRARRRRAHHPGGRRRPDELPGQRAGADAADRVDAGAHPVEGGCSCSRSTSSCCSSAR